MKGIFRHLWLTLRLNFRSRQPLIYGYVVPLFFLVAFGSVFRSGSPVLLRQMGQLLTITILGGACFGMPTALVAERERGVWRRYKLAPAATGSLVVSTMLARLVIVGLAVVMQIVLARLIYRTPFPLHPLQLFLAFVCVSFAFEGLGLVIAAVADNVPAVQALGQAIFLPMIMIGGVGVPLATLPGWAQIVAGFFPGRYAVEALQLCYGSARGLSVAGFDLAALGIIGAAACAAGGMLFRWDAAWNLRASALAWVAVALAAWVGVGAAAALTGRLAPVSVGTGVDASMGITAEQINRISFAGLPDDEDIVTPLAKTNEDMGGDEGKRLEQLAKNLKTWKPGREPAAGQAIRNLVSVASLSDLGEDPLEGHVALVVWNQLLDAFDVDQLKHGLAWMVLRPGDGTVVTNAAELGLPGDAAEEVVRDRDAIYARKFLGKLLGKMPE